MNLVDPTGEFSIGSVMTAVAVNAVLVNIALPEIAAATPAAKKITIFFDFSRFPKNPDNVFATIAKKAPEHVKWYLSSWLAPTNFVNTPAATKVVRFRMNTGSTSLGSAKITTTFNPDGSRAMTGGKYGNVDTDKIIKHIKFVAQYSSMIPDIAKRAADINGAVATHELIHTFGLANHETKKGFVFSAEIDVAQRAPLEIGLNTEKWLDRKFGR